MAEPASTLKCMAEPACKAHNKKALDQFLNCVCLQQANPDAYWATTYSLFQRAYFNTVGDSTVSSRKVDKPVKLFHLVSFTFSDKMC
jgi:hypothetical protein